MTQATPSSRRWLRRTTASLLATAALAAPMIATPGAAQAQAPLDSLGRPNEHILRQMDDMAKNPAVPEKIRQLLGKATGFIRGEGKPGVEVPKNAPNFVQFAWPTVSQQCIGGKNKAVGTAMAVPGPAALPLPGVPHGQVAFVFTALGTGKVAKKQNTRMHIRWINVNNGRTGITPLRFTGINPDGPATVNGVAHTGRGTVLAMLEGGISTFEKDSGVSNCNFSPTVAVINVR